MNALFVIGLVMVSIGSAMIMAGLLLGRIESEYSQAQLKDRLHL